MSNALALRRAVRPLALAGALYAALAIGQYQASLRCADGCFVEHATLYGRLASFARNDTRLNAWILAWVQHSLLSDPSALFDANSFHPALGTLTGSEHMLGIAIPMLPARAFTASAVTLHQLALAVSAWLLGVSTFAFARWLVRPAWIAIAAGAAAMAMPWRAMEQMHVQLLAAHWIPLLWVLALRLLSGESRRGEAWVFAVILGLQLLSSYYVAYLATISLGVLALAAASQRAVRGTGALRLAVAALPAYTLTAAVSLPYLVREQRGEIRAVAEAAWQHPEVGTAFLVAAGRALAPHLPTHPLGGSALAPGYGIPATLAVLALVGLAALLVPAAAHAGDLPRRRRQRVACLSLAAVALACFVLMLGNALRAGDRSIVLPGGWLAQILPGFANLRAPLRWSIPIALAAPLIASVGLARIGQLARARLGPRVGTAAVALPALVLLALDLRPRSFGAEAAWPDPERSRAAYAALAALPPGPVLEAPWGADAKLLIVTESLSQLASTLHWRPILNGFTAYPPRSYPLLLRVARGIPGEAALAELARLSGLRWILLHRDLLTIEAQREWGQAELRGRLRRAWTDGRTTILELPARPDTGALADAVARPAPERTLLGLSRAPLDLEAPAGRLHVAGDRESPRAGGTALALELAIENASARDWPGFDPLPDGLVFLRYAFADAAGSFVSGGMAPLDVDVPAGRLVHVATSVVAPARAGRFRLCLDLVQRTGPEPRSLPIPPVELELAVASSAPPLQGEAAGLAHYATWLAGASEVASYPCAARR
jgi:hypothetical protein